MKAMVVFAIFATVGLSLFLYSRNKDMKKLFVTIVSLIAMLYIVWVGFRVSVAIFPLKILNIVLGAFAWVSLIYYMVRGKYVWYFIFSPLLVPIAFVIFSLLGGSRYEEIWGSLL